MAYVHTKKRKQPSLASLKKTAWRLFSELVRRKGAVDGNATCVSCGVIKPWKLLQAGHFWPKSRGLQYWFHEKNVHCQCAACNLFNKEEAKIKYAIFMIETYGVAIVYELRDLPVKEYQRVNYERMIIDLKQKLSLYIEK